MSSTPSDLEKSPREFGSAAFDFARKIVEAIGIFAVLGFFAGFMYNYYYLHIFGLPVSFATLPWQYTIVYGFPIVAASWLPLLAVLVAVVGCIEIGALATRRRWARFGPSVVSALFTIFAITILAVAFGVSIVLIHRQAIAYAQAQALAICEGRVSSVVRIGLQPQHVDALRRLYPRDLAKLQQAMLFESVGKAEIPNDVQRAYLVSEDQTEYDILLIPPAPVASCADMTLFRIPKSAVEFERSFIVAL